MQSPNPREDVAGLEGPDYVALVIEWNNNEENEEENEEEDEEEDQVAPTGREASPEPARRTSTTRTIAAVLGALGALVVAAWGLRRLRAV